MIWLQCFLDVSRSQTEQYEDILLALGASSVTYQDAADQPLFEPGPGEIALWDNVQVVALFTEEYEEDVIHSQLTALFGDALPPVRFERLEDQVWERAWIEHFQPMPFGQRLWIYPSWAEQPANSEHVILKLDPGLAFGTGTHPTTALCLEWLDAEELTGKTVIDYGCGSGVLAIAALLLGAAQATGYDNDPQALVASHDNAEQNGVADKLQMALVETDGEALDEQAEIVLANILAGPLQQLAPNIAPLVKAGGKLVLSGILAEQAESVMDAYRAYGLEFSPVTEREGWVRLDARKPQ